MIQIKFKHLFVAATAALFASCDFLDVVPEGSATLSDIYKTPAQAQKMVIGCYKEIPNYYHPQKFPDASGADEFIVGYRGKTTWFHYKSLMNGQESPSSTYYALWSNTAASYPQRAQMKDIWGAIRNCYNVLNNLDGVPGITEDDKNHWKGEALFLIAYYHQIMLEYYGPIFLIKSEEDSSMPTDKMRSPYDECVDFIAAKYDEAAKLLPATQSSGNRDRATAAAALGFKARLLLYAASPLVNGNTEFYSNFKNPDGTPLMNLTYDREKWKKAMDAAEAAITYCEANGYKLYGGTPTDPIEAARNFHSAFVGTNSGDFNNWDEMLFGITDKGELDYTIKCIAPRVTFDKYSPDGFRGYYVPTWSCVQRFFTAKGLPLADDPDTKNINPETLVDAPFFTGSGEKTSILHVNREPRFYASIGYDRGPYEVQNQIIMLRCRRGEQQQDDGIAKNEYQTNNGYYCQKWVSKYDSYDNTTKKFTIGGRILPYLRMAELYLDYVEADFEYNKKLSAKSLAYLNKVRARCGLPTFETSWSYAGGIPTDEAKLRSVIHDERSNELAMEGRRFHDIRRWKIAGEEINPKEKSWTLSGKTAETFYKVVDMEDGPELDRSQFLTPRNYWLAIPIDQILIDPNLVQNPGY